MCDNVYMVVFNCEGYKIRMNVKKISQGERKNNNIYTLSEVKGQTCLINQVDESWL
jgi:hypothetical protein